MQTSAYRHRVQLGPLHGGHIEQLRPPLTSSVVVTSDEEDPVLLPGQGAEVRPEGVFDWFNVFTPFLSPESISLGDFLPLSSVKHFN